MTAFEMYVQPRILPETGTLALEVIDGPYRGVIYSYTSFDVIDDSTDDEMARVRFQTTVHSPSKFVADDAFDAFCSDILVSWVEILSQQDMREQFHSLLTGKTNGVH